MSKRAKIAIDGRLIGRRGVGRYQAQLAASLVEQAGREEYLLFVSRDCDQSLLPAASSRLEVVRLKGGNYAWTEQVELPWRAARLGCDLVHFTDSTAALGSSLPMVVTVHDTMYLRPLREIFERPSLKQRLAYAYRRLVVARACRRAAVVLTVSLDSLRQLEALGLAPGKALATPEGVSVPAVSREDTRRARAKHGLGQSYLLAPAAEDKRKNLAGLLAAYRVLAAGKRPPRLAVFGLGEGAAKVQLREQPPAGTVFLGYPDDGDLFALLAGAECLVFPSLGEGFGLPALEAMALGTPVVCGRCGALEEVCGDAALLVDPGDPQALAAAVASVLADGERRAGLVEKGRANARRFSWRETARQTLAAYRRVLA